MMAISGVTETAILQLIFNGTAWAGYADNAAFTPQTSISVALHSIDPGYAGDMTTGEIIYAGYVRVDVPRTTSGWVVTGIGPASCSPVVGIGFPLCTGGAGVDIATHFSVGEEGGGPSPILWSGLVSPAISCGPGVTPSLSPATTITLA